MDYDPAYTQISGSNTAVAWWG